MNIYAKHVLSDFVEISSSERSLFLPPRQKMQPSWCGFRTTFLSNLETNRIIMINFWTGELFSPLFNKRECLIGSEIPIYYSYDS